MLKIDGIEKGAKIQLNATRSYTAVTHDDVTALLHKPIADMGIVVIPSIESAELETIEKEKEYNGKTTFSTDYLVRVNCSLEFVNMDAPEERFKCHSYAYAIDSSDKAIGKAYSMAIKYVYLKTFMLESYDDEESRDHEFKKDYPAQYKNIEPKLNNQQSNDSIKTKTMLANGPSPSQISYLKNLIEQKKYKENVDWSSMTMDSAKVLISKLVAIKA